MSKELPPGWTWTTIEDVCDTVSKRGPDAAKSSFRYIDLGAIDNKNKLIRAASELETKAAPSRAKQVVRKGDVLFSNVRVYLENIALVPGELDGEVASTAFCVLRPKQEIESRYLYHYVTGKQFVQTVNELQRGNSPPSVQDADVKEQSIPLAPAPEQIRIVSKIDELFSRIDEGELALERVQKLMERYHQSVLKAAVTGELTREWREKKAKSGAPIETGEALLARILTARREAWEKAELDKMKAKGTKLKDDKWKQKYAEPAAAKLGLDEFRPSTWAQPSLEQATRPDRPIAYGVLQPGNDVSDGISMVRVCDVANGVVDQAELKKIAPRISNRFPRTLLQGGEVLLTLVGTIGRTAIVPKELAGANVARAVGVLTPISTVLADWLELCLRGQKARQLLTDNAREVARKTLNLEQLREFAVPVPCLEEQQEAVSRVYELLSRANAASDAIKQQVHFSNSLRQATLKSAFSGALVAQKANDEPASALLERIAAERIVVPARPTRGPKIKMKTSK